MDIYQNIHLLRGPVSKEIYDELILIKEYLVQDQMAEKYFFLIILLFVMFLLLVFEDKYHICV